MTVLEALGVLGGAFGCVGAILGLLWWLVWPRIEDKLQAVARSVTDVHAEISSDRPDTLGGHAKAAAQQLPELRRSVQQLADAHAEHQEWRQSTDRRVNGIEQALVALLGNELRSRVLSDDRDNEREATP